MTDGWRRSGSPVERGWRRDTDMVTVERDTDETWRTAFRVDGACLRASVRSAEQDQNMSDAWPSGPNFPAATSTCLHEEDQEGILAFLAHYGLFARDNTARGRSTTVSPSRSGFNT